MKSGLVTPSHSQEAQTPETLNPSLENRKTKECKFKGEWLEATVLEVSTWSADSDDEEPQSPLRLSRPTRVS